jgi:hypothetical protein
MGNWYEYDLSSRKALLILMERSKRPVVITAGKILNLSLETFTTVILYVFIWGYVLNVTISDLEKILFSINSFKKLLALLYATLRKHKLKRAFNMHLFTCFQYVEIRKNINQYKTLELNMY